MALFRRSTRSVSPTDAAMTFYERVAPALAAIAEAELAATSGGTTLSGPVRIAAPGALGRHRIAPVVHRFCEQHPSVQVVLLLSDRQIDLIAERIDIAVRVGAPRRASQITRRLGTSAQWVVASADYLARHPPIGPELQSLSAHRAVLRIQDGAVLDFREVLPEPARSAMPVSFISDDMAATADAVCAGLGIGVLPSWLVSEDVAAGRLVRLPLGPEVIEAPVHAVLPSGRQSTGRARALLDALAAAWA